MLSLVRAARCVFFSLVVTMTVALCACGSTQAPAETPDALADSDSDADRDTGRDAIPDRGVDTGTVHVPKAPRCPSTDSGVPDATPDATPDAAPGDAPPQLDAADAADVFDAPPQLDSGAGADAAEVGADADASADAAAPVKYPAVQVLNNGGRILPSPRIVPITFDGNVNREDLEDFVASFGCTPYWRAIGVEYGVFDATGGTPIHLAEPPPAIIGNHAIEKFLKTNIEAKTPGWEQPTPNTLYAIYYPAETTVRLGTEESCSYFGGFHSSFVLSDGTTVPYAVIDDCGGGDLDELTSTSTHEFIEASTDAVPFGDQAYGELDPEHQVYGLISRGVEVGDLCAHYDFFPADYPFAVQRSWSNLASLAGHEPCVPASTATYFNTVPELPDVISVNFASVDTRGVRIPVGGERTINVRLFADGPIDPWTVQVKNAGGGSYLSFSLDKMTGKSGDTIALTISKKSESAKWGAEPFAIYSTNGKRRTVSYGLVGH